MCSSSSTLMARNACRTLLLGTWMTAMAQQCPQAPESMTRAPTVQGVWHSLPMSQGVRAGLHAVSAPTQVGIPVLGVVENMAGLAQPLGSFRIHDAQGQDATQRTMAALRQAGLRPEVVLLCILCQCS